MVDLFQRNNYIIDESAGFARAGNVYNVLDTDGIILAKVIEDVPRLYKKILKFTPLKTLLGFDIKFFDKDGVKILTLKRRFTFFLSKIFIYDSDDNLICCFIQKLKWVVSKFEIRDQNKNLIAVLQGDWKDWKFKITRGTTEKIGKINKKWAGLIKELFTTADKYMVEIDEKANALERMIIIAACVIIDMVLKEYT